MSLAKDLFNGFQKLCISFVKLCTTIMKPIVKDLKDKQKEDAEMKRIEHEAYREERKKFMIEQARKRARRIDQRQKTTMGFNPPTFTLPQTAFWDDDKRREKK